MKIQSFEAQGLLVVGLVLSLTVAKASDQLPDCVYISSYHPGYAWSDGVEMGLRETLESRCHIIQFDMDTKRQKSSEQIAAASKKAFQLIVDTEPAVVITSDDNAAKYLIVPYLKDTRYPVIFSGVNWTVEEYGFPFSNVTGIVEVAPIAPMLQQGLDMSGTNNSTAGKRAIYLGAKTMTEEKNFRRISAGARKLGITLDSRPAESFEDWTKAYSQAQQYDFIIMGSNSGISNWDHDQASQHVLESTFKPSLTNHQWMMPYTLLGYTKLAREHGDWAGQSAIAILDGANVSDIPLATNRKWDLWVNPAILEQADLVIDPALLRKAKRTTGNGQ